MVANGLEGVPWAIDKADVPVNAGRLVAYAASGGADGVILPGDLRVSQSNTADGMVHMATGAAAVVNRYPAARSESYMVRGIQVSDIAVPGLNAGSSASHLVVIRIEDPQYGGQAPADILNGPYAFPEIIPGVPANTTRAQQVGSLANKPFYAVARIDLPAGAQAVTQGMIKDLRRLASPHYDVFNRLVGGTPSDEFMALTDTSWKSWPGQGVDVEVPIWATHADISIELLSIWADRPANVDTRIDFGGLVGPLYTIDYNGAAPTYDVWATENLQHSTHASFNVTSLAGQRVVLRNQAMRTFTGEATGTIKLRPGSQIRYRVEFLERPL